MSIVNFNFSGTVGQSIDSTILVGDNVQGSCIYDSSQSGNPATGLYTFTGSSKIHSFSLKDYRGGSQVTSDLFVGPFGLFQIWVNGSMMTINGVTSGQRNFQLILSNPNHSGNNLPTSMSGWNITSCVINIPSNF